VIAAILGVAIVVGGVAVLSVPSMSKQIKGVFGGETTRVLTYQVRPGELPISVEERGSLESSQNIDVYCKVEGQTTIISIVPEGQKVKKGDLLCTLDSAALRDQLVNQRITTKSAEANYLNARLTREVAEIAVKEYVEGVYVQDLATVEGEIKLAESDLMRAEDRLEWARRMFGKGYVSMATKVSEELNFKKAQFALEQAQSKKKVLEDYTKARTIKELKSEVKKARIDELDKRAAWKQAEAMEAELERQVERD
jgi:HlyD family secretion protein